jgi:hypothetical protein
MLRTCIYRKALPLSLAAICALAALVSPDAMAESGDPSSGREETIAIPLPLDRITVKRGADGFASFSGTRTCGRTGRPLLPRLRLRVLLPPNVLPSTVRATIEKPASAELPGQWEVRPAPPVADLGGPPHWPEGVEIADGRDVGVYRRNALHPTSFMGTVINMKMRQWRIAEVSVHPYRYNPVTKRLVRLQEGTLVLTFERGARKPIIPSGSPVAAQFREHVSRQVVNFETMKSEYERTDQ